MFASFPTSVKLLRRPPWPSHTPSETIQSFRQATQRLGEELRQLKAMAGFPLGRLSVERNPRPFETLGGLDLELTPGFWGG